MNLLKERELVAKAEAVAYRQNFTGEVASRSCKYRMVDRSTLVAMREGTPLLASVLGGTLKVHVFTLSEDQRRVYCVAKDDIIDEETDLCPEALAIKFKGVQVQPQTSSNPLPPHTDLL